MRLSDCEDRRHKFMSAENLFDPFTFLGKTCFFSFTCSEIYQESPYRLWLVGLETTPLTYSSLVWVTSKWCFVRFQCTLWLLLEHIQVRLQRQVQYIDAWQAVHDGIWDFKSPANGSGHSHETVNGLRSFKALEAVELPQRCHWGSYEVQGLQRTLYSIGLPSWLILGIGTLSVFTIPDFNLTTVANMKLLLIFTLINTALCQVGYIFLNTQYPDCNSCLDQTGLSCTGHYQSPQYAECMCKGDGSTKVNTCVSVCNSVDRDGFISSNIANQFYGYCVQFFRDMCPDAQGTLQTDIYEENCGAGAGPGLADSAESSPATEL